MWVRDAVMSNDAYVQNWQYWLYLMQKAFVNGLRAWASVVTLKNLPAYALVNILPPFGDIQIIYPVHLNPGIKEPGCAVQRYEKCRSIVPVLPFVLTVDIPAGNFDSTPATFRKYAFALNTA